MPPVLVEEAIKKELPCISNAMVVGDRKKFLSCILTLKVDVDQVGFHLGDNLNLLSVEKLLNYSGARSCGPRL